MSEYVIIQEPVTPTIVQVGDEVVLVDADPVGVVMPQPVRDEVVVSAPDTVTVDTGVIVSGAGGGGGGSYTHDQPIPSDRWDITHNLGFVPAGIFVEDTSGSDIEGDVEINTTTRTVLTFSAPFGGKAQLS